MKNSDLTPVGLISYFFPPIAMAGPARAYALFRYLPEFGYRPYVITVKDIVYAAFDTTLLSASDAEFIVRTESCDPARLLRRFGSSRAPAPNRSGTLSRWASPDFKKYWNPFALSAAERLIASQECNLFITTSPAPSTHQIGMRLKEKQNITWVADFRDMWVTNPIEQAYPTARQQRFARSLLAKYQSGADEIVAVNSSVAAYVGAEEVIPNGADPSAFSIWDSNESANNKSDDILQIGYFGATDQARSMRIFCESLRAALQSAGIGSDCVEVLFVGRVDEQMLVAEFERVDLQSSLTLCGYMPRREGVRRLSAVDALLVTTREESAEHMTTSKVFDYLVSGKQIIAITPEESELAQLLHSEHIATYSESSREDLVARLQTLLPQRASAVKFEAVSQSALLERRENYSWRTLARRYAELLDRLRAAKN